MEGHCNICLLHLQDPHLLMTPGTVFPSRRDFLFWGEQAQSIFRPFYFWVILQILQVSLPSSINQRIRLFWIALEPLVLEKSLEASLGLAFGECFWWEDHQPSLNPMVLSTPLIVYSETYFSMEWAPGNPRGSVGSGPPWSHCSTLEGRRTILVFFLEKLYHVNLFDFCSTQHWL